MAPTKLAVFDIDGTLLQSTRADDACFVRAFHDVFQLESVDSDWSHYESCTDAVVVPAVLEAGLGREPAPGDVARHRERFLELLVAAHAADPTAYQPTAGAQELLDALRATEEWAVVLATGGWRETSRFKLRAGGLDVDGIPLATASDARTREEIARLAYRRAARANRVEAFSRAVLVGDGVWDFHCARRLHAGFVGIGVGATARALRSAGAEAVRAHFEPVGELIGLLDAEAAPTEAGTWLEPLFGSEQEERRC